MASMGVRCHATDPCYPAGPALPWFALPCQAWRERKERHLKELEEKARLHDASSGALESLIKENEMLKQTVG